MLQVVASFKRTPFGRVDSGNKAFNGARGDAVVVGAFVVVVPPEPLQPVLIISAGWQKDVSELYFR